MSRWSGVSEAYAASFSTLCEGTIPRMLADLPDGPLLDAGSGTGTLTAAAREQGRDVSAVDSDPDMVAMTNAVAPGSCRAAALPDLPFADASFSSIAANFVVNHLPDPRAGVRELARILAPGGRLAMTIWPAGGTGWAPLVAGAFDDAGALQVAGGRLPAHLDFPRTAEGLAELASDAGLHVLQAEVVSWLWEVEPAALWTGIAGGVATPGARYLAQTPDVQQRVRSAFDARATQLAEGGLLQLPNTAVYVLATAPEA